MSLKMNPQAQYSYIPAITAYSGGVRAADETEIVHATLKKSIPWVKGFDTISDLLASFELERSALCGVELRCEKPHYFDGFDEFNNAYENKLAQWGLIVEGQNPVARTNVAPAHLWPNQTELHAFSFIRPSKYTEPSFVVAGAGDLIYQSLLVPESIVRVGEKSKAAWMARISQVMDEIETRMKTLGVSWGDSSTVDVYCAADWMPYVEESMLARMGHSGLRGLHWYYSRPPIEGLTFEMDLRGVAEEIWL
ncbi:MAG: hypothetical protein GWP30_02450 [Actinobacteria bacterium]|nr:hypothetical protein [Actinomycetota bacterium]